MGECNTDNMDKTSVFSKAFTLVTSHYVMTASITAFIFSTICFAWTTSYFSMWGIEFFDYASVSDMYAVALKLGIVSSLILFSLIICILFFIAMIFIFIVERYLKSRTGNIIVNVMLVVTLACTIFIQYNSNFNPFASVEFFKVDNIIDNSARVNVKLRWNTLKSIDCVAVIGGIEDYLFVWDYKKSSPIVLSRTSVMMVSVAVPKAPDFVGKVIVGDKSIASSQRPRDSISYNRSLENQQKYDEWVRNLKSVCG